MACGFKCHTVTLFKLHPKLVLLTYQSYIHHYRNKINEKMLIRTFKMYYKTNVVHLNFNSVNRLKSDY